MAAHLRPSRRRPSIPGVVAGLVVVTFSLKLLLDTRRSTSFNILQKGWSQPSDALSIHSRGDSTMPKTPVQQLTVCRPRAKLHLSLQGGGEEGLPANEGSESNATDLVQKDIGTSDSSKAKLTPKPKVISSVAAKSRNKTTVAARVKSKRRRRGVFGCISGMFCPQRTYSGGMNKLNKWEAMRKIAFYMKPSSSWVWIRMMFSFLAVFGGKMVAYQTPKIMSLILDRLGDRSDPEAPQRLFVMLAASQIATILVKELSNLAYAIVVQDATRKMNLDVFSHLMSLDMNFHKNRNTGILNAELARGYRSIQTLFGFSVTYILPTIAEFCLLIHHVFTEMGRKQGYLTLATIFLYLYFTFRMAEWRSRFAMGGMTTQGEISSIRSDALMNYETVASFTNEKLERKRIEDKLWKANGHALQSKSSLALLNIGQGLIYSIGMITVLYGSAQRVPTGHLTAGNIVQVNQMLSQISQPLNFIGTLYSAIKSSFEGLHGLLTLLQTQAMVKESPNAIPLDSPKGKIEFKNVVFRYPGTNRTILKGINITMNPGEKIAIVGKTGAGKSTISQLLFRHYDVLKGNVSIDGHDVRDLKLHSLRHAIGIVPQDMVLFNEDIEYNIRYGRPDATRQEVIKAAKIAGLHNQILKMPRKYRTVVGERGLKLSGGERQRMAIARVVLKNPKIVIFDEATSSLDSHTERDILRQLEGLSEQRTTLVIAHRLSTVVDADKILVLKDGRIVEEGTHAQLIRNRSGSYARMWNIQASAARKSKHTFPPRTPSPSRFSSRPTPTPTMPPTNAPTPAAPTTSPPSARVKAFWGKEKREGQTGVSSGLTGPEGEIEVTKDGEIEDPPKGQPDTTLPEEIEEIIEEDDTSADALVEAVGALSGASAEKKD
ncbi:hypothetical protein AAMO2058_000144400 [Amorphochlora amoebiformis]